MRSNWDNRVAGRDVLQLQRESRGVLRERDCEAIVLLGKTRAPAKLALSKVFENGSRE